MALPGSQHRIAQAVAPLAKLWGGCEAVLKGAAAAARGSLLLLLLAAKPAAKEAAATRLRLRSTLSAGISCCCLEVLQRRRRLGSACSTMARQGLMTCKPSCQVDFCPTSWYCLVSWKPARCPSWRLDVLMNYLSVLKAKTSLQTKPSQPSPQIQETEG